MFESLHIQGFRAFEDLKLLGLGAVNLLVGRNNVGKTTVLEAINIRCAGSSAVWEIGKLLTSRQEIERESSEDDEPHRQWDIRRLFYRSSDNSGQQASKELHIGPMDGAESTLTLSLGSIRVAGYNQGEVTRQVLIDSAGSDNDRDVSKALILNFGDIYRRTYTTDMMFHRFRSRVGKTEADVGVVNCSYLPAGGLTGEEVGDLWDRIVLTDLEFDVLNALKIIEPSIERVSLIESRAPKTSRVAMVRRSGSRAPEPLGSLGDGMNRIFQMALGLANSKGGVLLVDEVENGIHYSVQEDLWRFLFEGAARLGIQVFATTHSWDCIEAFQKAAVSHPARGALIRLHRHDNNVVSTTFNEHRLSIATKESIEVR